MPLQDWFDRRIHQLLFHNLGYQIALPIMSVLYLAVYIFKVSKEHPLKPTLQPHQTTTLFVIALLLGMTFLAIGLWVTQKEFYIFFLMQVGQIIVYLFFAFTVIIQSKTIRICCMKFEVRSDCSAFTVRIVTAVSHAVLGLSTVVPMSLCGIIISSDVVDGNTNQDFSNMLDVAAGGCFYLFLCHACGCICELFMGSLGLCVRRRDIGQRHVEYDEGGVKRNVSYDISDEII